MEERERIYSNRYMGLFNDVTLGLSDGVGYLDTLETPEVLELYHALRDLIEGEKK